MRRKASRETVDFAVEGECGDGERKSEREPVMRRAIVEATATMETLVAGELEAGRGEESGG